MAMKSLFRDSLRNMRAVSLLRKFYHKYFPKPEDLGIDKNNPLRFVANCNGVIHVGAHEGQEAWIYNAFRCPVIWYEANPGLMDRLKSNLMNFKNQKAVCAALSDTEDKQITFHITNNDGGSSSLFQLGGHLEMYPGITVENEISLISTTLERELAKHDPKRRFDALVLDVQGAELLVLKGARSRLAQFKWIYTECADFEIYKGGCTYDELKHFLAIQGFTESNKFMKDSNANLGSTFDVLFVNNCNN